MARRRIIDGRKIYNEPWDSETRDVFLYVLSVMADNFGLLPNRPGVIARDTDIDEHRVRDRLDVLAEHGTIIPYQEGGADYFAVRKWQDYQKVHYLGKPSCPLPDNETLLKLSQKTRETIETFAKENVRAVAVAVAVDTVQDANASSNPIKTGLDYFFERLQNHIGIDRPVMPFGRAGRFLKQRVAAGDTADDFRELTDWFFDKRIRGDKSSANWSLFESAYNAGCLAVDKQRRTREAATQAK